MTSHESGHHLPAMAGNFYLFNSGEQTDMRTHGKGRTQAARCDTGYLMEWNAFARCNTWSARADHVDRAGP